jgi:hypothetical protein
MNFTPGGSIYQEYGAWSDLLNADGNFMELAPGNVLAALVKLISKSTEMPSVDIWESVRACAGKNRARD